MFRSMLAVLGYVVFAQLAIADDRSALTGTWKVVTFEIEFQDTGERSPVFGKAPKGYIIFTPEGRTMSYLEAESRKPPKTDEERAAAFRTMIAYTGKHRIEGDRFITSVDGSWNVAWNGTEQERQFKLEGGQLRILTQWNPAPLYDNRVTRGVLVLERER
jgi:hypothetical protein